MSIPSDSRERFYKLAGDLLELLIGWVKSPTGKALGKRLSLLASAAWFPSTGAGNSSAAAFLLNISPDGIKAMGRRNNVPILKPGDERIYRFADLTTRHEAGGDQ